MNCCAGPAFTGDCSNCNTRRPNLPARPLTDGGRLVGRSNWDRLSSLSSALLPVLLSFLLSACDLPYLAHAAYEEAHLLWNRQPIEQVLQNPRLSPEMRERLQ